MFVLNQLLCILACWSPISQLRNPVCQGKSEVGLLHFCWSSILKWEKQNNAADSLLNGRETYKAVDFNPCSSLFYWSMKQLYLVQFFYFHAPFPKNMF